MGWFWLLDGVMGALALMCRWLDFKRVSLGPIRIRPFLLVMWTLKINKISASLPTGTLESQYLSNIQGCPRNPANIGKIWIYLGCSVLGSQLIKAPRLAELIDCRGNSNAR